MLRIEATSSASPRVVRQLAGAEEVVRGIDVRKLSGIGCDVEAAVSHEQPGQIMRAGLWLDLYSADSVRVAEG